VIAPVFDRMVPLKIEVVPRVAPLPTDQKMLCAEAPPARTTWLPVLAVRNVPTWKIHTAFGSPPPLRVTSPVILTVVADFQIPGASVRPPISVGVIVVGAGAVRPDTSRYAAVKAVWAAAAVLVAAGGGSVICITPFTIPAPAPVLLPVPTNVLEFDQPVIEVPGLSPTSPVTTVLPVVVTVEPPRIP
jgi:hypothetical protein